MKVNDTKISARPNTQKASQSFFSGKPDKNFFGKSHVMDSSFFKPLSNYSVNGNGVLQTKSAISQPNNKYEEEAKELPHPLEHDNHKAQDVPEPKNTTTHLDHWLAHQIQQTVSPVMIQKAEDWDFTPADYDKLTKAKKDLTFGTDSDWVPPKLKENILDTLKFVLTAKKPERTKGVNVKDFYHGHLVVPRKSANEKLKTTRSEFNVKSDELEAKGRGGESFDPVTEKNLKGLSEAMVKIEKLATPLINEALKRKGATVIYHTFELNMPTGMKPGSPVRNIKTDIGGSPAGYSQPDPEEAGSYSNVYYEVLQFAFLVDENGVVHVTVGTTSNLSRVTGTPLS